MNRNRIERILKFVLVGAIAAIFYLVAMVLVVDGLQQSAVWGAVAGFSIGTIVSYAGNSLFTYDTVPVSGTFVRFIVVVFLGLLSNIAISWLLEGIGFHHLFIGLIILTIVPAQNFCMHEMWTFRTKS